MFDVNFFEHRETKILNLVVSKRNEGGQISGYYYYLVVIWL